MSEILGHVDTLEGNYVCGWALHIASDRSVRVEVKDAEGRTVGSGLASKVRKDLDSLGFRRNSFAFRVLVECLPANGFIWVYADGEEVANSPLPVGANWFDGDVSFLNGEITGWVTERTQSFTPPTITIVDQSGAALCSTVASFNSAHNPDPFFSPAYFRIPIPVSVYGRGTLKLDCFANAVLLKRSVEEFPVIGFLENLTFQSCSGWLFSPTSSEKRFTVEIFCNDKKVAAGVANRPRRDIQDVYPGFGNVGFNIPFNLDDLAPTGDSIVSIRIEGSEIELFDGPFVFGSRAYAVRVAREVAGLAQLDQLKSLSVSHRAVLQTAMAEYISKCRNTDYLRVACPDLLKPRARSRFRVNIIIPIYKGTAITKACIESVLSDRNPETDLVILINDYSPEKDMAAMLWSYRSIGNVIILTNESNRGFIGTVNRGLAMALDSDVLLLNSDTEMHSGCLNELCAVLHSSSDIGTVTAISNNATIFSYPHVEFRRSHLEDVSWQALAQVALDKNKGSTVDVPTAHGFCMLIRRELLTRIKSLNIAFGRGYGEENDLCQRAADLGFRHVAAGGALVEHRESISFGDDKTTLLSANISRLESLYPEYTPLVMEFEKNDPLRKLRWELDEFRLGKTKTTDRRFVLVIQSWLGGGTLTAVRNIERFVGYSGRDKITIQSLRHGGFHLEIESMPLKAVFAATETRRAMEMLNSANVDLVVIHSMLGFTEPFFDDVVNFVSTRRSLYYAHDFYAMCPRVTLLNALGEFCDVAKSSVCTRCIQIGGCHEASKFSTLGIVEHRDLFDNLLSRLDTIIAPSVNAATYFRRAFPSSHIRVIAHPEGPISLPKSPAEHGHNIVLLGALSHAKGSERLLQIAKRAQLEQPDLRFHVVGHTNIDDDLKCQSNVVVWGTYTQHTLPVMLKEVGGRVALFLHLWPETYSFTLSETIGFGLLPIVPDIGAPAERLSELGYGVIYPRDATVADILNVIVATIADEAAFTAADRSGLVSNVSLEESVQATRQEMALEMTAVRAEEGAVPTAVL